MIGLRRPCLRKELAYTFRLVMYSSSPTPFCGNCGFSSTSLLSLLLIACLSLQEKKHEPELSIYWSNKKKKGEKELILSIILRIHSRSKAWELACSLLWQAESRSLPLVSSVTCWLSRPNVALPLTLGDRLFHSGVEGTRATLAACFSMRRVFSPWAAATLHDPTRVEHPLIKPVPQLPSTPGTETKESIKWLLFGSSGWLFLQGTNASMVTVLEGAPEVATLRWWSNQVTNSLLVPPPVAEVRVLSKGSLENRGKLVPVAWLTMDSRVPVARGLSQDGGLEAKRGRPKPCMATWPFSHVSSATS